MLLILLPDLTLRMLALKPWRLCLRGSSAPRSSHHRLPFKPRLPLARPAGMTVAAQALPPQQPVSQQLHPDIAELLISAEQLQQRVAEVGKAIAADYSDKKPLIVG